MINRLNDHLQQKFGCKVYKLSLDGGFTCPNRDGTVGTNGCLFCDASGAGSFAAHGTCITKQIEQAKQQVRHKNKGGKYIAYFQSFTNTYAPVGRLEALFTEAISHPDVVALSIATRPDCLEADKIALLKRLNRIKPVWVELGLQTQNETTARYLRRGYDNAVFEQAVHNLQGLTVIVHLILGLPGETIDDMVASTEYISSLPVQGVKFHLLHVLKNTDLEQEYRTGRVTPLTLEQYTDCLCRCIEHLRKDIVIHRLTGDGDKRTLVAPLWSTDKKRVLNHLNRALASIEQGCK